MIDSLEELTKLRRPGRPCTVVTSVASLEAGFSRALFMQVMLRVVLLVSMQSHHALPSFHVANGLQWHSQPHSCILFTHTGSVHEGSVAHSLLSRASRAEVATRSSSSAIPSRWHGLADVPSRFRVAADGTGELSRPGAAAAAVAAAAAGRVTVAVQQVGFELCGQGGTCAQVE